MSEPRTDTSSHGLWAASPILLLILQLPSAHACDWMLTPAQRAASVDDSILPMPSCCLFPHDSSWAFPQSVAGPSLWNSDCHPSLTADGMWLYFCAHRQNGPPYDPDHIGDQWNLYRCHRDTLHQRWSSPEWLGPNVNPGLYPTISPDGMTLYYAYANGVWMSTWSDTGWTAAVQAPHPINDDQGPSTVDGPVAISRDGLTMYVTSERSGGYGDKDIWQLRWNGASWSNPENCGTGVNTSGTETHPAVSPDGLRLYFSDFTGDRPGPDYGGVDLFYSEWTGAEWSTAVPVPPPVNTDLPVCSAFHAANGLIYLGSEVSEGGRGEEDIWVTSQSPLPDSLRRGGESGSWENTGELEGAWYVYDLVEAGGAIYAATAPGGRVYRSVDGGATWGVAAELPGASRVYSLLATTDGAVWAGTYPEGAVFRSSNGTSWQRMPPISGATAIRAMIETSDGGDILAATCPDSTDGPASFGRVFRLRPGATAWERLGLLTLVETGVYSLFEVAPQVFLAGARCYRDRLYMSRDNGVSWDPVELPYEDGAVTIIATYFFTRTSDGLLWAGGWAHGPQGMLLWSDDNGFTWQAHDEIPNGPIIVGRIFDMVEANDGTLLIGVHPGTDYIVMSSTDHGVTWESAGPLPGAWETLCLMKSSDGTIYAGTTPNGDVYRWVPSSGEGSPLEGVCRLTLEATQNVAGSCMIRFQLPEPAVVNLAAYDAAGRRVGSILNESCSAGAHEVRWDFKDDQDEPLPQGAYLLRLRAGGEQISTLTTLVR